MFGHKKEGGIFLNLQPKITFILGVIIGILVICTIGFFILLATVLDENVKQVVNNNINQQQAGNQPSEANPSGDPSNLAGNLKPITKDDHIKGSLDAPIKLVEFSDFRCGHCGKVFGTLSQLVSEYQGKVAWVFKHFPVLGDLSVGAAVASECAYEQGKFWEYTDELIANQQLITEEYLSQAASKVGLNVSEFAQCLASDKYLSKVAEDAKEAQSVGITGTPGIYVNDVLIKGAVPIEQFREVIDSML